MLTNEEVEKYRKIYKARFGKKITKEEAYEQGAKLLRLVQLVWKRMTEDEYKQLQKRREETKNL